MAREEHVSLWHPWQDKPVYKEESLADKRHKIALLSDLSFSGVEEMITGIAKGQYYALATDILDGLEVDPLVLRDKRSQAYLSRTGGCVALRIQNKRKSGFIIPARQWKSKGPSRELVERMQYVFRKYGFEALTPSSLSEKILRSTLGEKTYISRPSHMVRSTLLRYHKGGRIQSVNGYFEECFENDLNKAYLSFSRCVPDPRYAPIRIGGGGSHWMDYPCSFIEVTMTRHSKGGIQPVQIVGDGGELREPYEGETFTDMLWGGTIQDCIEEGYTLHETIQGYSWHSMSTFMERWSDILWDGYSQEQDELVKEIEKQMMVGFPGRCLKSPEKYTLIHKSESRVGDRPLLQDWSKSNSPLSQWCMRIEEDIESTSLTPIGSYIVSECNRKIYHDSKREESTGSTIIRVYIDSFTTDKAARLVRKGTGKGEYKTKYYTDVTIRYNQFMGIDAHGNLVTKLPSVEKDDQKKRQRVISEMRLTACAPP